MPWNVLVFVSVLLLGALAGALLFVGIIYYAFNRRANSTNQPATSPLTYTPPGTIPAAAPPTAVVNPLPAPAVPVPVRQPPWTGWGWSWVRTGASYAVAPFQYSGALNML